MRLCQWCLDGRLAAAELELFDWQRHEDCPIASRVLLASLLSRRGMREDALAVLTRSDRWRTEQDAWAAQSLVTLLTLMQFTDSATQMVIQLHSDLGHRPDVTTWLDAMQVPGASRLPPQSLAMVDHLAADLRHRLDLLPSLTAAQRINPDPDAIGLLRQAMVRLLRAVHQDEQLLVIYQASAELALLADDPDDALRWAHRGLKLHPYSASLALVVAACGTQVGMDAGKVLRDASAAHPTYPDLKRALILHEFTAGHRNAARMKLSHWLAREPRHPVALQLVKELAA